MSCDKTLIIYSHPYEKSLNHAILNRLCQLLTDDGQAFDVIDLYKDNFNPVLTREELNKYRFGKSIDSNVLHYQQQLMTAKRLLFVFPIWWNDIPAILKGFLDKVMTKGFAYKIVPDTVKGLLNHIECCGIYSTSGSPTWYIKKNCGNPVESILMTTLKQIGINNFMWQPLGNIDNLSREQIRSYLLNVKVPKKSL